VVPPALVCFSVAMGESPSAQTLMCSPVAVRVPGTSAVAPSPLRTMLDEPREASQARSELGHLGPLPAQLNVEDESRHKHEITWSLPENLVGDVNAIGGLRVVRLGTVHARILPRSRSARRQSIQRCP
jgi:hypothetical protein